MVNFQALTHSPQKAKALKTNSTAHFLLNQRRLTAMLKLETFPNQFPDRDYEVEHTCPEFTAVCPKTGQPDFAHFTIDLIADTLCLELKSLKMYFWSYRNEGAFHEKVTNTILDDIVKAIAPRFARITAKWYVRGGIYTNVIAEHRMPGWKPQPAVELPTLTMERGLLA